MSFANEHNLRFRISVGSMAFIIFHHILFTRTIYFILLLLKDFIMSHHNALWLLNLFHYILKVFHFIACNISYAITGLFRLIITLYHGFILDAYTNN